MMRGTNSQVERHPLRRLPGGVAVGTFVLLLAVQPELSLSRSSDQSTFHSPEDASGALFAAVQKHDERAITRILGAGAGVVSSGDELQDTLDREQFTRKYQEMHRVVREPRGVTVLYIGAENWPFPVPLVSRDGVWRFDPDDGANEIRFRRIGENEVTAIGICHALVAAETRPGTDNEADSLVQAVLPSVQGANRAVPFHGYNFRILSKSAGNFTAIAYPSVYRSSGVETFIVDQNDVVREKDLGPKTATVVQGITANPSDPAWARAESP